jgi:hypothetical protein
MLDKIISLISTIPKKLLNKKSSYLIPEDVHGEEEAQQDQAGGNYLQHNSIRI